VRREEEEGERGVEGRRGRKWKMREGKGMEWREGGCCPTSQNPLKYALALIMIWPLSLFIGKLIFTAIFNKILECFAQHHSLATAVFADILCLIYSGGPYN